MPFNYNISRLESEPDVFIHEEARIPRSFEGLGDSFLFSGAVNGKRLTCSSLAVDRYSSDKEVIIYYLLSKDKILDIAKAHEDANQSQQIMQGGLMQFALTGSEECQHETSTRITSDSGGILVLLQWFPSQLKQFTNENLTIHFLDLNSEDPLNGDVRYNLTIFDKSGTTQIVHREELLAMNAADLITIPLPADGDYPLQIQLISKSTAGPSTDNTRSGLALGYVVVPEFGSSVAIATTAASSLGIILATRFMVRKK
jgi:hypothetical protein